jgi:hypothetical protein
LYLFFLNGIPFQNNRFYLLGFPLFLLLTFPAYQFALDWIFKWKGVVFIAILMIQFPFVYYALNTPYTLSRQERLTVDSIKVFNQGNLPVYTSGFEGPLRFYLPDSEVNGLFRDSVKGIESDFVLVIDSTRAMNQDPGSLLISNLRYLYSNHPIKRRKQLEKNWTLYEFRR